ncbi:MAG: UvrD-helicase domain-containing protein, partial [Candidatus Kapaibacterium sp.]
MNLTPSQKSALDLSTHTAIIANAGSGKTAVLVERYLNILEKHPELHPRNIIAITFTDSSARDLRKKISEALNERLKNCRAGKDRDRLLEIRRQLGSAYISTIHSFAIQLLRTYPVEANVDASFTILTSPEDQLLQEECIRSASYSILKKAYADENSPEAALLPVFRLFGRRKISSLIHSFLGSRFRVNELLTSLYSQNDEEILTLWNERIDTIVNEEILGKIDITFFHQLLQEKTTGGKNRQGAEEALSAYSAARSVADKLRCYSSLISAFFTKEYTLNGRLFSFETKEAFRQEAELAAAPFEKYRDLLNAAIESIGNPSAASLYLQYSCQLLEIFTGTLEAYREQKINYNFLDYDDVIEYALRLVQKPDIQAELIERFAHILIDEYQDTDAAQYAIAKALTGGFTAVNRLTVVGDPKQSIYSFRNADLELYLETIREISAAHAKNSPVILSETFRILSHPLAFINKVSEELFDSDAVVQKEYEYTPLVEGRNEIKEGTVEFILPSRSEDPPNSFEDGHHYESESEEISADEIELIASKIKQITVDDSGKYFLTEKQDGILLTRPPQYKEIGILLRSRTHQSEIESTLRKNHIPFVTYGGKGFYARPEITDITNYLRFLVNSNDDIALAGVLRSPYFGLSDIDLYRLAPEYDSISNLWERLSLHIASTHNSNIARAYKQLSENLQIVGRVSTPFLLQKVITESGIYGVLQSLPDGRQKIANLEKYTRFALAFGKEGYSGIFDFIERIMLLIQRDEMEAQAEPQNDLNAVHLMTIHNSKGLEFPIVFLPFLHTSLTSKDRRSVWNVLDKELGIGLDLPEQAKTQPVVELIKIRSKEKEIEEEKRIFYAALTRARDHLILSASPKESYKNTRMGWVLQALQEETLDNDAHEISISATYEKYRGGSNSIESFLLNIPIIRKNSDIPASKASAMLQIENPKQVEFQFGTIEPSESIGRYSPSQLLTYLECPTKYYLRYQLGLPEEERLPYHNEADILSENVQGTLFGQIVHKVLEKAGNFVAPEFIDMELLENTFQIVCDDLRLSEELHHEFSER